jgi:hypothetical protein
MDRNLGFLLALALACVAGGVRAQNRLDPPDAQRPADAAPAPADAAPPPPAADTAPGAERLEEVVVEAERPLSAASSSEVNASLFKLRPHSQMIQILDNIPGLVVAQHQGGNKAPQWLIRGFDADHGTDIAVFVDDLPVNLPSHAHGQGYADVNFVIPETLERYELFKGPYFPQFGDFDNAAALNLVTKDRFPESFALAEGGSFDSQRYVLGASPQLGPVQTMIAAQAYFTNGPFIDPENLSRYNGVAKLTLAPDRTQKLQLESSIYQGDWDASGQIPARLVDAGLLDRFGAIDPTEGGRTDREDLNLHWSWKPRPGTEWWAQLYGSHYALRLWSDFTFYRDTGDRFFRNGFGEIVDTRDAVQPAGVQWIPGDGIEQDDDRWLVGGKLRWTRDWALGDHPMQTQVGAETRNDSVMLQLWRQVRRNRFFPVNRLRVTERSFSGWMGQEVFFTDWMRVEAGLRGDVFVFSGRNRLPLSALDPATDPNFTGTYIDGNTTAGIVSPKANLIVTPEPATDVYLNFGEGFHSNDARNALLSAGAGFDPLTRSIGGEGGVRTRRFRDVEVSSALWILDLDSELVFSGDVGSQQVGAGGNFVPEGPTRRWGVDFDGRWQMRTWLVGDYSLAWADPRFLNGDAIPLAPTLLMNGGLTADLLPGLSVALRARYLGDRPANESRTLTAQGWFLLDLVGQYRWRNVQLSLQLLNLTDTAWREAQFADQSCVRREVGHATGCYVAPGKQGQHPVDPVQDVHFTPGNPFGVLAGLTVYF